MLYYGQLKEVVEFTNDDHLPVYGSVSVVCLGFSKYGHVSVYVHDL
jgi:hypothetical protein